LASCLTFDQLIGIRENKLSLNEHVKLKQHLAHCTLCQEALDGLNCAADTCQIRKNVHVVNKSIHNQLNKTIANRIHLIRYYAAAALLIVLLISTFQRLSRQPANEKLFSEYFAPYPNTVPLVRGGETSTALEPALAQYELGHYNVATALLNTIMASQPDNLIARFYLGICLLEMKDTDKAIQQFDIILKNENFELTPQAKWYVALSHIKNKNIEIAKQILNQIVNKGEFEYDRSRDLLKKINSLQ